MSTTVKTPRFIKHESQGVVCDGKENDCTVRALVNATEGRVSYEQAEQALRECGRKDNCGAFVRDYTEAYKRFGVKVRAVCGTTKQAQEKASILSAMGETFKRCKGITLERACLHMRKGGWVVIVDGHALAVVNGKIIDTGRTLANKRVMVVYKVENS